TDAPQPSLSIRDSGPGLTPAQRERLFEPFHGSSQGGSGLGLHICREIAEQLGARLALDDRLDPDGRRIGLSASVSLPGG
ncbi:MAG: hypothetical protein RLZZ524_2791, partial [Pseudomonadota bacterium]